MNMVVALNDIKKIYAKFRVKHNISPDFSNMAVYGTLAIMIKKIFPRILPYFGFFIETLFSVFTYILRSVSDD